MLFIFSQKKSGLLSMLPQPRNAVPVSTTTKSFVPHVLTQKPNTTAKKKPLPTPMKKAKPEANSAKDSDDSDDDDDMQNDFFSINKTENTLIEDMPLDIDVKPKGIVNPISTQREPRTLQSYFKPDIAKTEEEPSSNMQSGRDYVPESSASGYQNGYEAETSNSSEVVLDDEAVSIFKIIYRITNQLLL